jgi:CTP:molybdopterin cytidylyltransferase MocA
MGDFKPLLDLGGKALAVRTVESLFRGGAARVTLVLGFRGDELEGVLRREFADPPGVPPRLRFVRNRDFMGTDMLASIKAALAVMEPGPFFLLPADMPAVRGDTLRALAKFALADSAPAHFAPEGYGAESKLVCFPVRGPARGHPPLISAACIPLIMDWQGGGGLRGLWESLGPETACFPTDDPGCFMDADTPEDLARLGEYWLGAYQRGEYRLREHYREH